MRISGWSSDVCSSDLSDPDDLAMQLAATTLGGNFVSRLNMNLREDKHWSYGAFASIGGTKAQRPFIAYAPVQTDKTSERSEERRVGKECVSTGRSRWQSDHEKKKTSPCNKRY